MARLSRRTARVPSGIVHFGPGAFFRAFTARFTDEAMATAGGGWGIVAVSLRGGTARDQLVPQDCAYTAVTLEPDQQVLHQVEAITEVLVAPEDLGIVLQVLSDPGIRIVSLTVTEKGYCHVPATGALNLDDPGIVHDLAQPDAPRTAIGFLVSALQRRRKAGARPFTVLSCDNLPDNGRLVRGVVLDFARALDPALADWIASEGAFPSTMVDRITPATTQADVDALARRIGALDLACVQHEAFRQWVIEDRFVDGARPNWEAAGAQFVTDVKAHEFMKLRCLNGTHSALAYLGYLAGFKTVAETVANSVLRSYCKSLWHQEIVSTVAPPEGEDLHAYCDTLLKRYTNPAIRHRTWQIAMDGSQKLPQRLLGTVADNLEAERDIGGLAMAIAAWMRYVGGTDDAGQPIDVRDPLADRLHAASEAADTATGKVTALLGIGEVFDPGLVQNPAFREPVMLAYTLLCEQGTLCAVAQQAR